MSLSTHLVCDSGAAPLYSYTQGEQSVKKAKCFVFSDMCSRFSLLGSFSVIPLSNSSKYKWKFSSLTHRTAIIIILKARHFPFEFACSSGTVCVISY